MSRVKEVHDRVGGGTVLCELILLDSERNELLAAYEHRRRQPGPYPVMALQIFAHNVREHAAVAVYLAHAPDVLSFAHGASLGWLEQRITGAYRARREAMKVSRPTPETKEATPGC